MATIFVGCVYIYLISIYIYISIYISKNIYICVCVCVRVCYTYIYTYNHIYIIIYNMYNYALHDFSICPKIAVARNVRHMQELVVKSRENEASKRRKRGTYLIGPST